MGGQEKRMHCSTLGILGVIAVPNGFKEAELGLSTCLLIWLRGGLYSTYLEARFISCDMDYNIGGGSSACCCIEQSLCPSVKTLHM